MNARTPGVRRSFRECSVNIRAAERVQQVWLHPGSQHRQKSWRPGVPFHFVRGSKFNLICLCVPIIFTFFAPLRLCVKN